MDPVALVAAVRDLQTDMQQVQADNAALRVEVAQLRTEVQGLKKGNGGDGKKPLKEVKGGWQGLPHQWLLLLSRQWLPLEVVEGGRDGLPRRWLPVVGGRS